MEKDYPRRPLPAIKKLSVDEEVRFPAIRRGSIRSMINNYQGSCLRRFRTWVDNGELIVVRLADAEKSYE